MADLAGILSQLESRLGAIDGEPAPLAGGITNRNYRVRFGESEYVVRLPGKDTALLGISRDAERVANTAAAGLGIAPEVVAADQDSIVTRFVDHGTAVDPDGLRANPAPVARALRAFHALELQLPARFWVPELLSDYARIVTERGGSLPADYVHIQGLADRIAQAMPLSDPQPCHDDLLPGNLMAVAGSATILLVDWEYAGMGHPLFDLGNLAVNNEFDDAAEERLLSAYFDEPPTERRRAALKLMRLMSDAREAAWGVVQGVISELDFDFGDYAARHFARLAAAANNPDFESWLRGASA